MRSYYRKKLDKLLGAANNESFIQLLWATHALQSNCFGAAKTYIDPDTIPVGAITTDMTSKLFIQKWEIETLANELMTTPKVKPVKSGKIRELRHDHFQVSIECADRLRKLENAEFSIQKKRKDITIEMGRIAARQFEWQRGFVNIPRFYRNAFIYGQGECATYFEEKYGISFNRFSQIGFMLFGAFKGTPVVNSKTGLAKLGISQDEFEKVLAMIALPFSSAAKLARKNRKEIIHVADKPSILRQFPCLRFGRNGERIRAPLPELILERITSGVFYDVVGGGGRVRDEYGKRFEDYCYAYLSRTLPKYEWEREFSYRKKPRLFLTPDILCSDAGQLEFVFECKATRMSHEAMFGKEPMTARGYQDLIKAVFQLWRFFSHCRRRVIERDLSATITGVVLTLDNWLVLSESLRKKVLYGAIKMAEEKEPLISEDDRKPIVFVAVPEMEKTLGAATEQTFKEALLQANAKKYWGWRLDGIHKDLLGKDESKKREYLFSNELGNLLPWWGDRHEVD